MGLVSKAGDLASIGQTISAGQLRDAEGREQVGALVPFEETTIDGT